MVRAPPARIESAMVAVALILPLALLPHVGATARSEAASPSALAGNEWVDAVERLKAELHTLTPAQANARVAAITPAPTPPRQDKIDHFVVLFMVRGMSRRTLTCGTAAP